MYVTGNGTSQVFEGGKKCNFFRQYKNYRSFPKKKRLQMYWRPSIFFFDTKRAQHRAHHRTEKEQRAEANDVYSSAPFVSGCPWDVIRSNAGGDWQAKWSARVVYVNIEKHHHQHSQTRVCCKPCDNKFGGTGKRLAAHYFRRSNREGVTRGDIFAPPHD